MAEYVFFFSFCRILAESLMTGDSSSVTTTNNPLDRTSNDDLDLLRVLEMSKREEEERERRLREQEEEELQKILELSLQEK